VTDFFGQPCIFACKLALQGVAPFPFRRGKVVVIRE